MAAISAASDLSKTITNILLRISSLESQGKNPNAYKEAIKQKELAVLKAQVVQLKAQLDLQHIPAAKAPTSAQAVIATMEPAARVLAKKLLPETPHSLAAKINEISRMIKALEAQGKGVNTVKEIGRQKMLADLTSQLATLTAAAKKMRDRKVDGVMPTTKPLSPEEHKVLSVKLSNQLIDVNEQIKEIAPVLGKGDRQLQDRNKIRAAQLLAYKEALEQKKKMADAGNAPIEPRKLSPDVVTVPRKPLQLPALFGTPTPAEVTVIIKLLSMGLKRHQKEQDDAYQMRLRAYSKRALVRLARMTIVAGQDRNRAMQIAVDETLREDQKAIEAEFRMGGEVKDTSADAMDTFVDAQTPELVAISESAPAEIPAIPPTQEQTDQLVDTATTIADELSTLPAETTDAIRDELDGATIVPTAVDESTGMVSVSGGRPSISWGKALVFGAVICGGVYLWQNR